MPPEELTPLDIPPPPEAERLAALKQRRDELEKKLADEKAQLRRMQAERRALLRKQIKRSRSRLSSAERKRRTQRLIVLGSYLEHKTEGNPAAQAQLRKGLDAFVTRNDHRELFGLPPLDKPTTAPTESADKTSAPLGSQDNPIPGFRPKKLDDGSWGALFTGDTSTLPDELIGLWITVTPKRKGSKSWDTTVSKVLKRTEDWCVVRTPPKPK